jgi:flagellar export protein FliJ
VEEASKIVVKCEEETESCYAAWVLAGQRVASLERLDERRRSEWSYSEAKAEAASVDDIVNARWGRQPSSGVRSK